MRLFLTLPQGAKQRAGRPNGKRTEEWMKQMKILIGLGQITYVSCRMEVGLELFQMER